MIAERQQCPRCIKVLWRRLTLIWSWVLKLPVTLPLPPARLAACESLSDAPRAFPGSGNKHWKLLDVIAILCRPGFELPAGSHAEVGWGLPGKHRSRNSPPTARSAITPALPAPTITRPLRWNILGQRLLLLGEAGVTAAQRSARSRTLSTDSTPARQSMCFTSPTFGLSYLLL